MNAPESKKSMTRDALVWTAGGALALAAVFGGRWAWHAAAPDAGRGPASVNESAIRASPGKLERLFARGERLSGKPHQLHLTLVKLRSEPAVAVEGEPLRLIATVKALAEASRVDVAWSLPPDVEATSGRVQDALIGMQAEEEREIEITVTPRTRENREITVIASQGHGDRGQAAYNTTEQEKVEAELERNAEIARARYGDDVMERIRE